MSCSKKSNSIIKRQQQGTTSFKMQVVKTLHCFYRVSWLNSAKLLSLCNFSFPDGELYYHVWIAAVYMALARETPNCRVTYSLFYFACFCCCLFVQRHRFSPHFSQLSFLPSVSVSVPFTKAQKFTHTHTHTHISTHQWATVAVDFGTASDGQGWWRSGGGVSEALGFRSAEPGRWTRPQRDNTCTHSHTHTYIQHLLVCSSLHNKQVVSSAFWGTRRKQREGGIL